MYSRERGVSSPPRSFFLTLWDDNGKNALKDMDGSMLMTALSAPDCLTLYLEAKGAALTRGGEIWDGLEDMLSVREYEWCTLMDILLAMAFSHPHFLNEGYWARELWETALDKFSPLILQEIETWLDSGGVNRIKRPPFDIKALLEIAVNIKGAPGAAALFPLSPELVEKGAMLPLNPVRRFLPPRAGRQDDRFGEILPEYLGIIPNVRELWFEMDKGQEIWTVKPWSEKHPRSLRREFFKSPVPWSLPMSDNNLTKLFLHRACPPSPPPHSSSLHPESAEYFIFMPDDMEEKSFLCRYFLERNMIPVFARGGLEYLTSEMGEDLARFMSRRGEGGGDPAIRLWNGAGMGVFLNLFVSGFIHPALDILDTPGHGQNGITGARAALLRAQEDKGRQNRIIKALIRAVAKLKQGDLLLSFPWDKNIGTRPIYTLSELSAEFPSPQWWISAKKHFGENAYLQKWFYGVHTPEGVLPEPIAGLESAFASMRGDAVKEAVKKGREGGARGGGGDNAFLMHSGDDMGGP